MIRVVVAALLVCAVLASPWRLLSPIASILSSGWAVLFGVIYLKHEAWSVAADLLESVPSIAIIFVSFLGLLIFILKKCLRRGASGQGRGDPAIQTDYKEDESILKPLLFPARTAHTRLFPKKHSFSYSYLLVGIPVGWRGVVGSFLSADFPSECLHQAPKSRHAWFNVGAADYLERGGGNLGLEGKLRSYLETQVGRCSSRFHALLSINV